MFAAAAAAAAATTPATPLSPLASATTTTNRESAATPVAQPPPASTRPLRPSSPATQPLPLSPTSSFSSVLLLFLLSLVLHPSSFTHPSLFPTLSPSLLAQPFPLQRVNSSGPPPNRAALKPVLRTRHTRCVALVAARADARRSPGSSVGGFVSLLPGPSAPGAVPGFRATSCVPADVPCTRTRLVRTARPPVREYPLLHLPRLSPSLSASVSFHAPASFPSLPLLPFNPLSRPPLLLFIPRLTRRAVSPVHLRISLAVS